MARSIRVLGIAHELQGPGFQGYVEDASYHLLLKKALPGVDRVFEEASGRGPSIAENLATSVLGTGRYLDVDPPQAERPKHGIPEETAGGEPIDHMESSDSFTWMIVDAQRKREKHWVRMIEAQSFARALLICGIGHSLSVTFLTCYGWIRS
jgi:hypothetical protein